MSARSRVQSPSPVPAESHRRLYYPAATATGIVQLPPLDPAQDLDPVPPSLKPSLRLLLVKIHALRRRIDFLDERVTDCRRDAGSGLELNTRIQEYVESDSVLKVLQWRYERELRATRYSMIGCFKTLLGYNPLAEGFARPEPLRDTKE